MEQQLRYNTGKPKLSYFYCNARALERLQEFYATEEEFGTTDNVWDAYDSIFEDVAMFLAEGPDTGFRYLVRAFQALAAALEFDLGGNIVMFPEEPLAMLLEVPLAVDAYCAVCVYGESKYERGNFRKGAPITVYLDSMLRHLRARLKGEHFDRESGHPTAAHALWNLWQALDQPDFRDDRLPAVQDYTPPLPLSDWAQKGIPVPAQQTPADQTCYCPPFGRLELFKPLPVMQCERAAA